MSLGLVLALSIAGALRLLPILPSPHVPPVDGMVRFFFAFAIATVFLLVLIRYTKGHRFFGFLFAITIFLGVGILVSAFAPDAVALAAALCAVLLRYFIPRALVHDFVLLLGVSGIALSLGLTTDWRTVAVIMVALSVYDIIAVYKTKHMVTLVKNMASRGALFAFIFTPKARGLAVPVHEAVVGKGVFLLGTGDLVVPAMFAVAALQVSPAATTGAVIGAFLGFLATQLIFFSQSTRQPMPALPPIVTGTLLGFLVPYLLKL